MDLIKLDTIKFNARRATAVAEIHLRVRIFLIGLKLGIRGIRAAILYLFLESLAESAGEL